MPYRSDMNFVCRIPHYDQRLNNLVFKKKFKVTVDDLSHQITNVMEASREVADSMRIRKLLELVLAFGTIMRISYSKITFITFFYHKETT